MYYDIQREEKQMSLVRYVRMKNREDEERE